MSISNGWSSSSLISDVLPEEYEEEEDDGVEDDLILSDNERLRGRVDELEKIVVMQRNELMLLQASTADILRRLQMLEGKPLQSSISSSNYNSLPRSSGRMGSSRSTYAVSSSPSTLPRHSSPMSKSMYVNGLNNNGQDKSAERTSSRRNSTRGSDMVNVYVGKSARGSPMRKWVSTQDVKDLPVDRLRRLSSSSEASTSTPIPMTPIVNTMRRLSSRNSRTCQFQPTSGQLPIFVSGKSVNVPVPSGYENLDPMSEQSPPNVKATLKHVYSFRSKDVRSNIDVLPTGEVIFFSANLVVMMMLNGDDSNRKQRIYHGHTCDVKCISVHPNKVLIASGQSSCHSLEKSPRIEHTSPVESPDELVRQLEMEHTEAHIRIWDSVKLTTILIIGGLDGSFERGIGQLSFSTFDAGAHLACVDESTKHTLSVWNWQKIKRVAEVKCANDAVFECHWHPTIKNLIVLYGKGHFSFFTLDSSNNLLIKTTAVFEGRDKPKTILSMCFGPAGQVVTGDSNGTISIWDPKLCKTIKQAHSVHPGGVYALRVGKNGKLVSGGKDRMISEWELDDLVRSRRPIELPDERGFARVIVASGSDLLVGTSTNSLLQGNFENNTSFGSLIEGDIGELSGIVACGSSHMITASHCGSVRKWSINDKKVEWSKNYMNGIECVDVDSSNTHLILGFSAGKWQIVNMTNHETIEDHKEGSQGVSCVKFAPTGGTFIIGTKDPSVSIYRIDASRNLLSLAKINHIPSPIISADWSSDGQYIRAQSSGAHLLFWSRNGEILDGSGVRDVKWATSKCRIGFETAFVAHAANGQMCGVGRSPDDDLLVVGMENGTVRLYQNPVTSLTAGCVELSGHGKLVRSVCFSSKNTIFSGSTADNSIFEWQLE